MTVKHLTYAMEVEAEYPTPLVRLVYIHMAYRADKKAVVRKSQREIAEDIQVSSRSVAKAVVDLESMGLLSRLKYGRYGITMGNGGSFNALTPPDATPRERFIEWVSAAFMEGQFMTEDAKCLIWEDESDTVPIRKMFEQAKDMGLITLAYHDDQLGVDLWEVHGLSPSQFE